MTDSVKQPTSYATAAWVTYLLSAAIHLEQLNIAFRLPAVPPLRNLKHLVLQGYVPADGTEVSLQHLHNLRSLLLGYCSAEAGNMTSNDGLEHEVDLDLSMLAELQHVTCCRFTPRSIMLPPPCRVKLWDTLDRVADKYSGCCRLVRSEFYKHVAELKLSVGAGTFLTSLSGRMPCTFSQPCAITVLHLKWAEGYGSRAHPLSLDLIGLRRLEDLTVSGGNVYIILSSAAPLECVNLSAMQELSVVMASGTLGVPARCLKRLYMRCKTCREELFARVTEELAVYDLACAVRHVTGGYDPEDDMHELRAPPCRKRPSFF